LGVGEIPVQQARLERLDGGLAILGRGLDGPDSQGAERLGVVVLVDEVETGPLEQVDGLDILDDDIIPNVLPDVGDGLVP
jgi:hypothetical protein